MEIKHTKGEWFVHEKQPTAGSQFVSFGDFKGGVEVWAHHGDTSTMYECIANAKLIAAAPDLLDALNDLVFTATKLWDEAKCIKDTPFMTATHPIIENAKQAIKKATE